MKTLLTALLITTAAIMPAHATLAKWKDTEKWSIVGDPAVPFCGTWATFPGLNKTIHITLNVGGWAISVQGVNAIPGNEYETTIFTNKKYGRLIGTAVTSSTVRFANLPFDVVKNIAVTPYLTIDGIGKFSMKGSMEAIVETIVCFKAMTDIRATVTAPTPTVSWEHDI